MTGRLEQLLNEIVAPTGDGIFNVRRIADGSAFYAGRDVRGCIAVLIRTSDAGRTVPLRLAGIEVSFSTPYRIAEPNKAPVLETLTAIVCTNHEKEIVAYFASVMESVLPFLGTQPSTEKVTETVRHLVDLFQKLRNPRRNSLVGLVGELSLLYVAADIVTAIRSWRSDSAERFDFSVGNLRLDVKASSSRQRVHEISFEQANPPGGTVGLIASVWIEALAGGMSLLDLLNHIEARLQDDVTGVNRLRMIVADSLGDALPAALRWCFDLQLAEDSLRIFDVCAIPAIRPPLPTGVSSARFTADLGGCTPMQSGQLRERLDTVQLGLLPNQ